MGDNGNHGDGQPRLGSDRRTLAAADSRLSCAPNLITRGHLCLERESAMSRLFDRPLLVCVRAAAIAALVATCTSAGWADDLAEARFRGTGKPDPIRISHVRRADAPAAGQSDVTFDLAWDHSWRAAWEVPPERHGGTGTLKLENWDAAWVFIKFRKPGAEEYSHATLSTNVADHTVPAGAKLDIGLSDDGERGIGAFVYRAAAGYGANDWKGMTLRWLHQADGVDNPGAADLRVFALRMVYVPRCAFWVGDGTVNATTGPFSPNDITNLKGKGNGHTHLVTSQFSAGDTIEPFRIESEQALTLGGQSKKNLGNRDGLGALRTDDFTSFVTRTLPARFPKGYAAFYCMRRKLTRGEYVAFLNTLNSVSYTHLTLPTKA